MTPITQTLSAIQVLGDAPLNNHADFMWACRFSGLPEGNYRVLGTVTKDEISFDCEPYVEKRIVLGDTVFKDYSKGYPNWLYEPARSFRSLLQSKGIHFVNPYGDKNPRLEDYSKFAINAREHDFKNWDVWQNSLVEKVIIIEKI